MNTSIYGNLKLAATEIIEQFEIPSPASLVMQLAEIERQRKRLMQMVESCSAAIDQPINEDEHQSLMDFLYLQSAKKNVNSAKVLAELHLLFMVDDMRDLPTYSLWDAYCFIRSYKG